MLCPGARVAKVGWYHARLGRIMLESFQGDEVVFSPSPFGVDACGASSSGSSDAWKSCFRGTSCSSDTTLPLRSGRLILDGRFPYFGSARPGYSVPHTRFPFRESSHSGHLVPIAHFEQPASVISAGRIPPCRPHGISRAFCVAHAITDPSIAAWSPWHSIVSKRTLPTDLKSAEKQPKPTRLNQ